MIKTYLCPILMKPNYMIENPCLPNVSQACVEVVY